jgi:hypothetical protein
VPVVLSNRSLHLIDVENLAQQGNPSLGILSLALNLYDDAACPGTRDLTMIGCDRGLVIKVGLVRPGARLLPGRGPNGGESAMLAAVDPSDLASRFPQVIIGSGDHAFAPLARALRHYGTSVGVVGHGDSIARELHAAASWVRYLDSVDFRSTAA